MTRQCTLLDRTALKSLSSDQKDRLLLEAFLRLGEMERGIICFKDALATAVGSLGSASVVITLNHDNVIVNDQAIPGRPGQLLAFALMQGPNIAWHGSFFWGFHSSSRREGRNNVNNRLNVLLKQAAPSAYIAIECKQKNRNRRDANPPVVDVTRFALQCRKHAKVTCNAFTALELATEARRQLDDNHADRAVAKALEAISVCEMVIGSYAVLGNCLTKPLGIQAIKRLSPLDLQPVMRGIANCLTYLAGLRRDLMRDSIPAWARTIIKEQCLRSLEIQLDSLRCLDQGLRNIPELTALKEVNPLNTLLDWAATRGAKKVHLLSNALSPADVKQCQHIFSKAAELIEQDRYCPDYDDTNFQRLKDAMWGLVISIATSDDSFRFPNPDETPKWCDQSAIRIKNKYFEHNAADRQERRANIDVDRLGDAKTPDGVSKRINRHHSGQAADDKC